MSDSPSTLNRPPHHLGRPWLGLALALGMVAGCVQTPTPPAPVTPAASLPSVVARPTFTVVTFNIQNFGPAKSAKPEILSTLAAIIRRYDVVAVQEISDLSGQAPLKLLAAINGSSPKYGLVLSGRTGREPDDRTSQEQYAFYYRTETLSAQDQGELYPDGASDDFQREPFAAGFVTKMPELKFVLITVHTKPEASKTEIPALAKVLTWAQGRFPGQHGFLILGDLNASGSYVSTTDLEKWRREELPYRWIVPDESDSNVAGNSARAYDRIIAVDGLAARFNGRWGVDRAFTSNTVSDHWPVWAEFTVQFGIE